MIDRNDAQAPDGLPPHRRRPRYRGTHPRRFDEKYKELRPDAYPEIQDRVRERGGTPAGTHVPILVTEVMEALRPTPGEVVADCTLGYGGHAREFLLRTAPDGLLVGLDVDGRELERSRARLLESFSAERLSLHRSNYAGVGKVLAEIGRGGYDILFADLGVSSMQIDDPTRGFTYKQEGPLDMRMDDRIQRSAADLLLKLGPDEIAAALDEYGDEPDARVIASEIDRQRTRRPIRTTSELVDVIFVAKGFDRRTWRRTEGELHPAARTFQALRILVNDELGALRQLLRLAPYCLRPGGRIGIISFHSGEDRLVKHAFRDGVRDGTWASVAGEPIRPGPAERRENPRASAAKLRWAVKPA